MKKYFFIMFIVVPIINYFSGVEIFGKDINFQNENKPFKNIHDDKNRKTIVLRVNLKEQSELQEAVDNGHQPWRLEPIFVAFVEVATHVDKTLKYEDCHLKLERNIEAEVMCKGLKDYIVKLKRLIRPTPDGIWTAVSIEFD